MKTINRIVIAIGLLLATTGAWAGQPNVILILADDLGIGGLHCYGTDYPTLLGLAGIKKPKDYVLDGEDLTPFLTGKVERLSSRAVYSFYPKYVRYSDKTKRWALSWRNVIYRDEFKLIEYPEYAEYELFNLTLDRKEENNLEESDSDRREVMTQGLHQWLKEVGAPPLTPNPDHVPER